MDTGTRWIRVGPPGEATALDRWCAGVGPPARMDVQQAQGVFTVPIAVVTWNVHVGAGDIAALVADLRSGRLTQGRPIAAFVLLLQETYRAGAEVPGRSVDIASAGIERPAGPHGAREDVVVTTRRLGLSVFYAPSMRNGAPGESDEDRGNAIVSSLPLEDPVAIELPLERQRRVAVVATVRLRDRSGRTAAIRVVDTHFANMVAHHAWLLSEAGRARQARALSNVLPSTGALVVGGDFNSWFGFHDAAYRELARSLHRADEEDRHPTFGPLRLDHLLFRLAEPWRAVVRRADSRYGSDHYPLVAFVDVVPSAGS